ncbi:MAG: right-handed parallel beta-helix repeat-containing protein [Planctomycetota bacterium]|nr:right-handed parallel beta-helix repeat-containing protein [Planctomycetota bacterium]
MRRHVLVILLLCYASGGAAELTVQGSDPRASDDNPGTAEKPFKTIGRAAKAVEAGDTVRIGSGVYRERVVVENSGTAEKPITFEAAVGAAVVVTGADRVTQWTKENGGEAVFSAPWPHRFLGWTKQGTHPDDSYHLLIGRAEQVFVLGYPCHQVLKREQVGRGTFYVDLDAKRLYVCPSDGRDLSKGVLVEASARGELWQSKGAHIRVRGLRFRYAANAAQQAAAQFSGHYGAIEDCVFEETNSSGAAFTGENIVVRRCVFQDNGQLGFGANHAHNLLLSGCLVRNNNVKNFSRDWEAGGDKLVLCRGAVLEQSRFLDNRGNGVWFDIGNEECVVRNCLIAGNECAGIFYEISYGLHAHDNVIVGNGLTDYPGAWGASAGIAVSSSPNCVIERNLLIGNKEGFNFREQQRTTPRINDKAERWIWNHDETVRNNVLAHNRDAQVWGWFDVNDGRHWPASMQDKAADAGKAKEDIAADYQAKSKEGAPVGLDLAKLKLTFENNCYHAERGEGLFNWGPAWKKNRKYGSLDDVRKELSLESGGQCAEFVVGDYLTRDLRVPADSPALKLGCYPKGAVPGVVLGTLGKQDPGGK